MQTVMWARQLAAVALAIAAWTSAVWAPAVGAQTTLTPSAEQMVEQLKKPPVPLSRNLRNLTVEAADPASTGTSVSAAPKPSLSLLIQFDFNSARVKPESQQALANLAQALQSQALVKSQFAVEGHTDGTGRANYNQRLSQQRADAVRDTLVAQGIAVQRLQTAGKGASELANSSDPAAAENRRVRIVNLD